MSDRSFLTQAHILASHIDGTSMRLHMMGLSLAVYARTLPELGSVGTEMVSCCRMHLQQLT